VIEEAISAIWSETLCFFGPDDDPLIAALNSAGVIATSAGELRERFIDQMQSVFARGDLALPALDTLPWTRWDNLRRRL